jgi:hypothetical protein
MGFVLVVDVRTDRSRAIWPSVRSRSAVMVRVLVARWLDRRRSDV